MKQRFKPEEDGKGHVIPLSDQKTIKEVNSGKPRNNALAFALLAAKQKSN